MVPLKGKELESSVTLAGYDFAMDQKTKKDNNILVQLRQGVDGRAFPLAVPAEQGGCSNLSGRKQGGSCCKPSLGPQAVR